MQGIGDDGRVCELWGLLGTIHFRSQMVPR